jgi:hypothetical protein
MIHALHAGLPISLPVNTRLPRYFHCKDSKYYANAISSAPNAIFAVPVPFPSTYFIFNLPNCRIVKLLPTFAPQWLK